MKVTQTYQCEICEKVFSHEWMARFCESHPVPAQSLQIGDLVSFETRYDGKKQDVIESSYIYSSFACGLESWAESGEGAFMEKVGNRTPLYRWHQRGYRVKNEWQLGKDFWGNSLSEDDLQSVRPPRPQPNEQTPTKPRPANTRPQEI
jgi:hypothetical protein